MAQKPAEEKKHKPTGRRLRELRTREGQVPRSKDFPAAISLIAAAIYIWMNSGTIWDQWKLFFVPYEEILLGKLADYSFVMFWGAMQLVFAISMPVALVAAVTYFLASIVQTRGLVISAKALTPKFDAINPVEGLGRIFGLRGLSDGLKIIAKILLLILAVTIILRLTLNGVFWSPTCDESCVIDAAITTIGATIIAALIIYLLIGIIDIWISQILFTHDNRMTETELKREQRDEFGAPELRRQRRQLRNEAARNPTVRGFGKATIVVEDGGAVVGLAYQPGKIDVPIIVGKIYGDPARDALNEARGKGVIVLSEPQFLANLMRYGRVGEPIPQAMMTETAQVFVRRGVVK